MDAKRFDSISRLVGTQSDRRVALRTLAGGALGLTGLAALGDVAFAKSCNRNSDCNGKKDKCVKGKCAECKKNKDCKKNQRCTNKGKCRHK